jgi:DNA repair exonuclease SbcCD ATPase subunit
MITFRKITWKNFLSTGNNETVVQLDRAPTTLIIGSNGCGKSTLTDAISFALFGKPHRDINKPALLNSINKRDCLVSVTFDIGKHNFIINRGIKPNVFEIWQNGHMINQSSNTRDYQKYLEQNVLKLNHKSFHQIVVLGSSSFVPFMQLKSSHRREVIEDLLDINIFSKMNLILREESARGKESLKLIDHELDIKVSNISMQEKYIRDMAKISSGIILNKRNELNKLEDMTQSITDAIVLLDADVDKYDTATDDILSKLMDDRNVHTTDLNVLKLQLKALMKESKFYTNNDNCPSCTQAIDTTLRKGKIKSINVTAADALANKALLESKYDEASGAIEAVTNQLANKRQLNEQIRTKHAELKHINASIKSLRDDLDHAQTDSVDLDSAKGELDVLQTDKNALSERRYNMLDDAAYRVVIAEMLKDTGIKTKVIKEYLPIMNSLINSYLQTLDFFVSFNLDENFDESIRSRHRDNFSYASFSEGEKARIDLALLFTWRQIARMKNSTNTNLLILDETFDSSMDEDGMENLMKILNTLDSDSNVFVISHKGEILDSKFRHKIEFIKEHNFSKIKA